MMTDPHTLRIISKWLDQVAKLTRHKQGRLTAEELFELRDERAVLATLLEKDFPSGAFVVDSLHAVLQGNSFFPSYEEIRARVQAWWNENKPHSARQLSDQSPPNTLTGSDRDWLNFWYERESENFGPVRGGCPPSSRDNVASLIRARSPKAWVVISGDEERGL